MTTTSVSDVSPHYTRPGTSRWFVLAYGLGGYTVGVAGLVAMILRTLGVLPVTGGPVAFEGELSRTLFNLSLIAVFGLQHAIMAREAFKRRFTSLVPAAVERSTFTGLSGVLMGGIIWLWQPLPSVLWHVDSGTARAGLLGLCAFGWIYLLAATFAIDHFELFG